MDLCGEESGYEESGYDAYEYESEGCDDPEAADEYENQMYASRTGYSQSPGYASYSGMSSVSPRLDDENIRDETVYDAGPRYCMPPYRSQYEGPNCGPAESLECTEVGSTGYSDMFDERFDEGDSECDCDTQDDSVINCVPCGDPSNVICPLPDPYVQCPPCVLETSHCPNDDEYEFADHGASSICGENLRRVNEVIKNITPFTVLDEFMLSIANYTADKGEAMFDAMSNEVNNFKELIKEIYANRNDAVSELLKAEQRQKKNKYEKLTKQVEQKTEETMDKIRGALPDFDMAAFVADPSNYIYSAMMDNFKKQQPEGALEQMTINPDRNYRVSMHKRTWLMRESERVECDNEERMCKLNEMMAQLACLSEGLATNNKKLAAYNRQLESHATCLRNKLAYNETVLSCLADEIEINKIDTGKESNECPLIEPDDILTPYPSGYDYC